MSKKNSKFGVYDDDDEKFFRKRKRQKEHRRNDRKLKNALRTRNIDDIIDIDDEF